MFTKEPAQDTKLVVLQGLKEMNRFFSTYQKGDDPTKLTDGTVAYSVLGYCATTAEAQTFLYGKSYEAGKWSL